MFRHLGKALMVLVLCALAFSIVSAQDSTTVTLSPPQLDGFPQITAFLDVRDEGGNFVADLQADDLWVLENNQRLPLEVLRRLQPGAQFVVAINPGNSFAIRDGQGNSRFDYVFQALKGWAQNPIGASTEASPDDLSLLTTTSTDSTHVEGPRAWLAALETYQPDLRTTTPSLDILSRALEVAADTPPRPGMGRGVLFITPYPENDVSVPLGSLAARARSLGIQVNVWMISSAELFSLPGANQLAGLAEETGGDFFAYSATEAFPDVETYLEPLRRAYFLAYRSQLTMSGEHQIAVEIRSDGVQTTSQPQIFELQVAPPNPVFVSPPPEIVRAAPEEPADTGRLVPQSLELEILIEFLDGHPRELEQTTLYVDGEVVAQNDRPPFDRFRWELHDLTTSGRHLLRAEAVDTLGLSGTSTELPVQITIQRTPQGMLNTLSRNATVLAIAAVLMAGAVLLLVLILGGRIQPRPLYLPRARRRSQEDPVTQPVPSRAPTRPQRTRRRLARWASQLPQHLPWPQPHADEKPLAFLSRFANGEHPTANSSIPIRNGDITLGCDPDLAGLVLDDPSVEPVHARLKRRADGRFYLTDHGSVAGTWINYAPISHEWARLTDGDLIHIGRVGFSFSLNPSTRRQPQVEHQEPPS
jgi:hypothetical protein